MRNHLEGSQERPRLNVYRSGQHIYAQIVDDTTGKTLAAASSLDETLRDFKPAVTEQEKKAQAPAQKATAKVTPQKGAQGKGGKPGTQVKILLPAAQKGTAKTPVEALEAIAHNRKVATAREVGKLVAQRAKEKGVSRVVFDRGGYAYHGRVAALAEGAREVGLEF